MQQAHRDAIQSNFSTLVNRTDLNEMVNLLYEKGVFSEEMMEPFRDRNVPEKNRKRYLYREIMKRGPEAFGHLTDALSELGLWDILRDLDPTNPFVAIRRPPASSNPIPNREPSRASNNNEDFVSISSERRARIAAPATSVTPASSSPASTNAAAMPVLPPLDEENATAAIPPQLPLELGDAAAAAPEVKTPEYTLIKSTSFRDENDLNDLKQYKTRGRNRGVLVAFTYVSFQNNIEDERHGADLDCEMLKKLFSDIGFVVLSYMDLDYKQTKETLELLREVLVEAESVFIVVSSHGYEQSGSNDTDIRCSDGHLMSFRNDILPYFSNLDLPKLIGIPKVFICQLCRGGSMDFAWQTSPEVEVMADGSVLTEPRDTRRTRTSDAGGGRVVPYYSDILIAHSTLPGFVSHRNPKLGSWFIQTLCEVFAERAHNTDVDTMFTLIDARMRNKYSYQTTSIDRWGFNKRLYLHPGLYE